MASPASLRRFQHLVWATLALVVAVIVWGAFVRASGSGAGCGSHWPTCDGEIVPTAPDTKKVIELTHRVTSGLSAVLVLVQLIWSRRIFPAAHRVRRAAAWGAAFMLGEVGIGAGIVLLKYVADDASVGRAIWMMVHLCNTFLLVGALSLCSLWAGGAPGMRLRGQGAALALALAALAGTLIVGASGAVAALGDTLFPAADLGSALAADLSPTAHMLVRLRVFHPVIAVVVGFLILAARFVLASRREDAPRVQRWGAAVRVIVVAQLAAGLLNLSLLAPTWMQLVHLLLADVLWIALVSFIASALAEPSQAAAPVAAEHAATP